VTAGDEHVDERLALRMKEAADLLGVSSDTISRMTRSGEIPVIRLRGAVRIPRRALEAWLDEQSKGLDSW
jgi:excisionase family DNA binding protein